LKGRIANGAFSKTFSFYVSSFTNDKGGLFEDLPGIRLLIQTELISRARELSLARSESLVYTLFAFKPHNHPSF